MSKYDYGYDLTANTTFDWAFNKVDADSVVLEIGPSIGTLVYHLTHDKHCVADIVEIDSESGKMAARFARTSCIGMAEGNLECDDWYRILSDNKYDFIIILDVLEHIRNPLDVLKKLRHLLKEDGEMLLSVPNIAHNSVLINLLRNRFDYTNVGLLDNTHVHFYTYETVKDILHQAGFITVREQCKQISINNTEIKADYGCLPREVEAFLRTRPLGTLYQHLFTIKRGETQPDIALEYEEDKLYEIVAFSATTSELLYRQPVNPCDLVEFSFSVPEATHELRIDPLNVNCILSNLEFWEIWDDGTQHQLIPKLFTGNKFEDSYVFYDDDPQIYLSLSSNAINLKCQWKYICFDSTALDSLAVSRDIVRQYLKDYDDLRQLYSSSQISLTDMQTKVLNLKALLEEKTQENQINQEEINRLVTYSDELISTHKENQDRSERQIENLTAIFKDLESQNIALNSEIQAFKTSFLGKIYYQLFKK